MVALGTQEGRWIMDQEQLHKRAHERVEALKGFYIHAAVFVMVNLGLFTINALTAGTWWFYWPLIGWSIALGINGLVVFLFGGRGALGEQWEERKTRKLMEKEEAEHGPPTHRAA
jgi:hypothetical protein